MLRLLGIFFLIFFIGACTKKEVLAIGKGAPSFSLINTKEEVRKLSDYKGKLVVLRFWQKDCPACLTEMPALSDFYIKHKKELVVIAINMGDSLSFIRQFKQEQKLQYPMLSDQLKIASEKYKVIVSPTTFIVDKNGILRGQIIGELDEHTLKKRILSYL